MFTDEKRNLDEHDYYYHDLQKKQQFLSRRLR